ncbi:MAG: hypothetical protein XD69_1413, partial [Clostridia bacterium 62_21]
SGKWVATQDLKLAETPRKPEVLPQKIEIGGDWGAGRRGPAVP